MSKDEFCKCVYKVARQIPEGRVTTYGAIAKAVGNPKASRRVGYAMRVSGQEQPPVPAHRVVSSGGTVSCKASKVHQFLENEGIEIKNEKIIGFKGLFWDDFI